MHSISFTILQLLPTLSPNVLISTVFALLSLLDHLLSCFPCVKRSCCYSYFCLDISISSHVANLSRLLLRVLLDQVRSKNVKLFCIRLQGHLTRYEPGVPCPLAHFQGHQQFHCKLQLTDKIFQCIHSQILLSFAHSSDSGPVYFGVP